MSTILGISGSLRKGSINTSLLRAAAELAPQGTTIEIVTLHGIPLYDGDLETESGIPEAAQKLKERIARADGLIFATPEYNSSIPGVFKNAIDWLSRPTSDIPRIFGNRPIALVGATPGQGGTSLAQTAWLPILRILGARAWFGPRMMISGASKVFDAQGHVTDEKVKEQLRAFVHAFVESFSSTK